MNEFARHNGHLYTGIFSTKMVLMYCAKRMNDIAYNSSISAISGWGYMVANGANDTLESWERPEDGPSMNHPMFGSVDERFYKSLLGPTWHRPA
jgi:alpha-L-rhamnosidase